MLETILRRIYYNKITSGVIARKDSELGSIVVYCYNNTGWTPIDPNSKFPATFTVGETYSATIMVTWYDQMFIAVTTRSNNIINLNMKMFNDYFKAPDVIEKMREEKIDTLLN